MWRVGGLESDPVAGGSTEDRSTGSSMSRLRAAADVVEIQQVVLAEREAHARGWWRQMAACYHEDAEVSVPWFQGSAAAFVEASGEPRGRGVLHGVQVGPVTVHLNSPRAVAIAGAVLRVPSADEAELTAYLRLLFQLERRHEAWRIAGLRAVCEREVLTRTIPVPRAPAEGGGPPGRTLSGYLRAGGLPVDAVDVEDVDVEDEAARPEQIYTEVLRWADLQP